MGAAALIGIFASIICNLTQALMGKYRNKLVDDTLDVFACHGVGEYHVVCYKNVYSKRTLPVLDFVDSLQVFSDEHMPLQENHVR